MPACHLTAVQNHRDFVPLLDIGRTGHNLYDFRTDIDLTHNQFIRIRMPLDFVNLSYHNFLQVFVKPSVALHLRPGEGHRVHILLIRARKFRHICFNP